MNIQSISVVVPTKACVNNCKFCVSKMHDNLYCDKFDEISYRKRIKRAKIENVSTLILTGTGEVLQNKAFLKKFKSVLDKEQHPFPNVEIQTTGVMLNEKIKLFDGTTSDLEEAYPNVELLKYLGVNTISLSVSDIFNYDNNWDIIGAPNKLRVDLDYLCSFIKEQGFNLRLSLNMTNVYDRKTIVEILIRCKSLGADQITFRKLYSEGEDTPEAKWVKENSCKDKVITDIEHYIAGVPHHNNRGEQWREGGKGKKGYKLPFGAWVYSIMGMSVAIDDDCMAKEEASENLKYVILRENGKLYWSWDDEGSLLF
jgi:hypothetical protein